MYEGKLLDGRNRWKACALAGVEPRFTEFQGDDPIGWVVSQNLVRRHLTASQRAVVAFDLLPLLEKEVHLGFSWVGNSGKNHQTGGGDWAQRGRPHAADAHEC